MTPLASLSRRVRRPLASSLADALALVFIAVLSLVSSSAPAHADEPDWERASAWWPRLENLFTPVGWKDHCFRFHVFYDGTVLVDPYPDLASPELARWKGLGMQLGLGPSEGGYDPGRWRAGTYQMTAEMGRRWGHQGLVDRPTPVVWTEWRNTFRSTIGYVLRQEVFAHLPGGSLVESGHEPIFAWVRFEVGRVHPLADPAPCGILARINKPHFFPEMYSGRNIALRTTDARYPRELRLEKTGEAERPAYLVVEPDGSVRLGVVGRDDMTVTLKASQGSHAQDYHLHVEIPTRTGEGVDLLAPAVPVDREVFLRELDLGREAALGESDAFWSSRPATAATIRTPEREVNEFIRRNTQFGRMIAQRMPESGHYTNLTGSLVYPCMWATPTTMFSAMLLDTMGEHEAVGRYLEILRAAQGEVKPPGPAYEEHPGYFATPPELSAIDWLSDHGAILHAAAYHALVTDDQDFVARWLEPIVRGCEFIRDACELDGHDGVKGVLPPAVATDRGIPTQSVWNLGWAHRGFASAVRLLEREGHERAAEMREALDDYRARFVSALREKARTMPTWRDRAGRVHHVVPMSLSAGGDFLHPFYLDTGPLFLVWAGVLPADDPLMRSVLAFFREGPNTAVFDPHGNHEQPAVLVHEISSCEPCASFNIFHSHEAGDRERFLEGIYSMITGGHSRQTYIACETRGGVTGLPGHIGIYGLRLFAIDDLIAESELHLLRTFPRAWLVPGETATFRRVPTVFGPVDLEVGRSEDGKSVDVAFEARFHHAPERLRLHIPPVEEIERWTWNGEVVEAKPGGVVSIDPR